MRATSQRIFLRREREERGSYIEGNDLSAFTRFSSPRGREKRQFLLTARVGFGYKLNSKQVLITRRISVSRYYAHSGNTYKTTINLIHILRNFSQPSGQNSIHPNVKYICVLIYMRNFATKVISDTWLRVC